MTEIERRKVEHLKIVMSGDAAASDVTTGFERIRFVHKALPEVNMDEIDLGVQFLGRGLRAPLLVSSMTGGPQSAAALNIHIAQACAELGVAMGVGSQRIALEGRQAAGFGPELRRAAPNVPILANFGAAQLRDWNGPDMARRAVDMIEADALVIHLNPLQEAVQDGGDRDWRGLLDRIGEVCQQSTFPIIIKEVGAGISGEVARQLVERGVAVIDVAGAGGTSWAAVEAGRATNSRQRAVAEAFRDWGIPTTQAICEVRAACPETALVASGGIRDGIECAKAIRLGADVVGIAAGVLPAAVASTEAVVEHLGTVIEQLRVACFCTGSGNLAALREAPLIERRPDGA